MTRRRTRARNPQTVSKITVRLPKHEDAQLAGLIEHGVYFTVSEAIVSAVSLLAAVWADRIVTLPAKDVLLNGAECGVGTLYLRDALHISGGWK